MIQFFLALLGAIPLVWLLIGLIGLKLSAVKTGLIGLGLTVGIAVCFFDHLPLHALEAAAEGSLLAIWPILWAIIGGIFSYNVGVATGHIEKIKAMLSGISADRRIQVLILAWAFSGFLEGATGYGTAVAIPASILMALGFEPLFAAVICLLGNTAPTAFGSIGIPLITLAKVTDEAVPIIAKNVEIQLLPFIILLPVAMVWLTAQKGQGLKGVWGVTFVAGLSYAVIHYVTAIYLGPEMPSLLGGIVSLIAIIAWLNLRARTRKRTDGTSPITPKYKLTDAAVSWSPYLLLFIFITFTSTLFPGINAFLAKAQSRLMLYHGPGGKEVVISWILSPGTFIVVAAVTGGLIQGASWRQLGAIFGKTIRQLSKTLLTVCSIVMISKIMGYSGMIGQLAYGLAKVTGMFYPVIAPLLGALGSFLTGSDTSSNILFGQLQKQTALQLRLNSQWIIAANNSGATAGKLISPQNVAIAAAVTGLTGREGDILRKTFRYCLIYGILLGLFVMFK